MKRILLGLALFAPASGAEAAPTLSLPPEATLTAEDNRAMDSLLLPTGPWANGALPTVAAEGEVTETAWRIQGAGLTTFGMMRDLRAQLAAENFDVIFECDTDECGGFDFRFAAPVLPEPDMHVDLGDFRFLSARRGPADKPDYVSLLVSRSSDSGYVQVTRVGGVLADPAPIAAARPQGGPSAPVPGGGPLDEQLLAGGKVVLDDLDFASGTTNLGKGPYASLRDLARYLKDNPDKTVALVGHTDAEGSLPANIAVSRQRAQSVMKRLVAVYGVNPGQLSADGVGYLSPMASNLTAEGRTQNRRVEALITSTR